MSTDETRRVKAARSPPSVVSPPRSRIRWEAALGEEEAEDTGRSAAEMTVPMEVGQTTPASPPSPPWENPCRELFPAR